jgi:hypothetical protein
MKAMEGFSLLPVTLSKAIMNMEEDVPRWNIRRYAIKSSVQSTAGKVGGQLGAAALRNVAEGFKVVLAVLSLSLATVVWLAA